MEVGSKKSRFVGGWALAVNANGVSRYLSLEDIYEMARPMGEHVTEAEY
jgi:hypothetical protein